MIYLVNANINCVTLEPFLYKKRKKEMEKKILPFWFHPRRSEPKQWY